MKKTNSILTILILLLSGIIVIVPMHVHSDSPLSTVTYYVDTSFNSGTPGWHVTRWNKIQDAVKNCTSSANNYVVLVNGDGDIYNENVRVDTIESYTTLSITGNYTTTRPRVNGQGASKSTFELMNNKISISGFTIYNTIGMPGSWHGIAIGKTLEGMTEQNNITITNCYITQANEGILLRGGKNFNVSSNEIDSTSAGIWILGPIDNRKSFAYIYNNYIHGCTNGMITYTSCNNTILRNSISSSISIGIDLQTSSNCNLIYYNNISNCGSSGIKIAASGTYGCTNNLIYNNNFIDNNPQVTVTPGPALRNFWNGSYPICGNYYSLVSGTDNYYGPNQNIVGYDTIKDTSYAIATNNTDYYPWLVPTHGSVAIGHSPVTTLSPSVVGITTAILNGRITTDASSVGFNYGLTTSYGSNVSTTREEYIYAPGASYKVFKYWASNLTKKAETASYGGVIAAIAEDLAYIYVGGSIGTNGVSSNVKQYWKSNLTKKAETVSYGGAIKGITQDTDYVYVIGETTRRVRKYLKSDMSYVTQSVDWGDGGPACIAIDDTYVYSTSGYDIIYQYYKSDLTKRTQTAAYGGIIFSIALDTNYIYAGGGSTKKVFQYWKSNMTKKAETVSYGSTITSVVVDTNYVYAGGFVTQKVNQYYKSDLTLKAQTASYGGTICAIAQDTDYIYAGGEITSKVYQYYKTNMNKKTESASSSAIYALSCNLDDIFSKNIASLSPGALYHFKAWSIVLLGMAYGDDMTFLTKPNAPTSLRAQTNNTEKIFLTWTKGTGANNTRMQQKTGSYPTSISDGANVYNGTGTQCENTGLDAGTTYYYRAWSYAKWDSLGQWSDQYSSSINTTILSPPSSFIATKYNRTRIDLSWMKGSQADNTYIVAKLNSYPTSRTDGTNIYNGTGASYSHIGLTQYQHWYYCAWSWKNTGVWSATYSQTETIANYPPLSITFIYSGGASTAKVYQYWTNMTKRAQSTSYEGSMITALANDSTYIYAGGYNGVNPDRIYQYWQSNMTYKAQTGNYGGAIYAIAQDSIYIYAGGYTTNKVFQYWKSNLTYKAQTASYGGTIRAIVQDNTYLYVGGDTTQTIRQYWKSNLTYKAQTASYGGNIYAIALDSAYIYAGGSNPTYNVNQYWKSNLTYKKQTENYGGTIRAIVQDDTYLYAGGLTTQKVFQYWKSDLTKKAETASYGPILALAQDNTCIYAGGATTQKVYQYYKSDLTKRAETTSYGGDIYALVISPFLDYAPTYGTPSPINGSTVQTFVLTWSIPINDSDSLFNWKITCSNGQSNSGIGASNGIKSLSISGLVFSTTYIVWVNSTDTYETIQQWYQFTTRSQYIPSPPSPFTATAYNRTRIDLLWTKGNFADRTYVVAKLDFYPASRTDGTNIYNNTGTSYSHAGLIPGQHWCYRAWSWNQTDKVYSSTYSSVNTILSNDFPTYGIPSPTNGSTEQNLALAWSISINDANGDTFSWWINCSNGQKSSGIESNGTKSLSISGLSYSTTYAVWVNVTDIYGASTKKWYQFTTRSTNLPSPPSSFTATTTSRDSIILSWVKGAKADYTYIECRTAPGSWIRGAEIEIYNGTGDSSLQEPLDFNKKYYFQTWSYNVTDGTWSTTYSSANATTYPNILPTLGTPSPTNGSISQPLFLIWTISINDAEGDLMNWNIACSNGQSNSSSGDTNGTKSISLTGLKFSTEYIVWINVTDGINWTCKWYTFTVRDEYIPNLPTSFTATTINRFRIDLSWLKGTLADYTYIEAKLGSYPTDRTDGTNIYNSTGLFYSHTGLSQNQHWFYRAWSWNTTDCWSTSYAQTDTITVVNNPPSFGIPTPINGSIGQDPSLIWSIYISDPDDDTFDWNIACSNGQSNSAIGESNGVKSLSINSLAYSITYTIWVNATDGTNWTHNWYTFGTRTANEPGPPTSFAAIAITRFIINLSWVKGTNADYTYVEAKPDSYPVSMTDGANIYNGTDIVYLHTGLNPNQHWYYCAWSWNITDSIWSTGYAQIDTTPILNNPPNYGIPSPTNGSTGLELALAWSTTIQDQEGDLFNWTIECTNSQSNSANDDTNGSKELSLSGLFYSTEYKIWVNATDGYSWTYAWYTFTTETNTIPVISAENPTNNSITQPLALTWNCTITDPDEPMDWSIECSNGQIASGISSTGNIQILLSSLSYSTIYTIWTNVTDEVDSISEWFVFTTMNIPNKPPNQPTNEYPTNNSVYIMPETTYMNVTVSDPDGDEITVVFKWQNGTTITTLTGITNNSVASIYLPDYQIIAHDTTYHWYVVVSDGIENTTSSVWNFHTSKAWDLNGDRTENYIDLSLMSSNYLKHVTPAGSKPWDINNDGICNYLDLSSVSSHYGESY